MHTNCLQQKSGEDTSFSCPQKFVTFKSDFNIFSDGLNSLHWNLQCEKKHGFVIQNIVINIANLSRCSISHNSGISKFKITLSHNGELVQRRILEEASWIVWERNKMKWHSSSASCFTAQSSFSNAQAIPIMAMNNTVSWYPSIYWRQNTGGP